MNNINDCNDVDVIWEKCNTCKNVNAIYLSNGLVYLQCTQTGEVDRTWLGKEEGYNG